MEEKNRIDKGAPHIRDRFKMDPPENAWNLLDAELERRRAILYRQKSNRYKLLSIGLALLLILFVTTYYFDTNHAGKTGNGIVNNTVSPLVNDKQIINNKSLEGNNATANNISGNVAVAGDSKAKEGLATKDFGHSSLVPRSSSLYQKQQATANEGVVAINPEDKKQSNSEKQNSVANNGNIITGSDDGDRVSKNQLASANDDSNGKNSEERKPLAQSVSDSSEKQTTNQDKLAEPPLVNENSDKNKTPNDSITTKDSGNNSRWSIAAFYSPNYYAGNHLADNATGYGEDANDYSSREKSEYSYAAGLALRYDLTSHWSLSVGGTYSTIAYSITLPTIYAGYGSNDQLHYQYPTACGNIEIPNTSNTVLHNGDSINTSAACAQVVEFISVPVTVRFQVAKNRFIFYADAGVSANFVIQEKAIVTIGNTETTIINNIDGLQKMNYGYLFGAGIEYSLYKGMSIFIEPSFRGSITSLTQNTAYYCYPYAFSLNTGVSFHF